MVMPIFAALGAILVIILLDTLLGIILSIRAGTFNVRKLPQFLATNLLPFGGALLLLGLAACIAGEYSTQLLALFYAAAAATAAKFIAEIKDKTVQIFGEIDVVVDNYMDFNDTLVNRIREAIIEVMQKQSTASK
jgi:hypothetical protein